KLLPDIVQATAFSPNRPTEALAVPPDYYEPYQPQWTDLASPGTLARDAAWGASRVATKFGWLDRAYDPYDDFTMPLFGNYPAMHRLGDALNNLAEAARLMASCADWIALRIEACWMGNAADGAWLSIRHLALALAPAERVLKGLGAAYTTVVEEIK